MQSVTIDILDDRVSRPRRIVMREMLGEFFDNDSGEHPLLASLRSDIQSTFPELEAREILARSRKDFAGDVPEGPPIRLRDPRPEPHDGHPCLPVEGSTEGWFADHAFKIARVYDEGRRLVEALNGPIPDPPPCLRYALGRLRTIRGGRERIRDCIQQAVVRVLREAASFQCGRPFCPWFLKILSHTVYDMVQDDLDGPTISANYPPEWEAQAPDDDPSVVPSGWLGNLFDEFIKVGVEAQPEWCLTVSRLDLERRGIREAPDVSVDRWARYLRRLAREQFGLKAEVPIHLHELYVAYGLHRDCRKEVAEADPASAELDAVQQGIEDLVVFQEGKDREKAPWPSGNGRAAGPVEQLAEIQFRGWKLLIDRPESVLLWNAARNIHWFSWKLKAAAILAACLRYAQRQADPGLDPLIKALRPMDCLRSFPKEVRDALSGFQAVASGCVHPPDADGLGMRTALRRAGLKSDVRASVTFDNEFPEADWQWWVLRDDSPIRRLA
jgi:hypothetical protein